MLFIHHLDSLSAVLKRIPLIPKHLLPSLCVFLFFLPLRGLEHQNVFLARSCNVCRIFVLLFILVLSTCSLFFNFLIFQIVIVVIIFKYNFDTVDFTYFHHLWFTEADFLLLFSIFFFQESVQFKKIFNF